MNQEASQRIEAWLQSISLAWALPVLAAVVALIAWNRGVALLYGLVALLLAAVAVGWVAPRANLAGIDARRRLPAATADEGDTLELELEVETHGPLARYMLEIEDRLPWATPDTPAASAYFDRVRGRDRLTVPVHCDLRGEHVLGPLTLATAYPLGMHRRTRVVAGSEARLLVYPTPLPLRHLPLLATAQNPDLGADTANRAGTGDLFLGVREYRHGDSRRHVHWSATARHGSLMVKEFDYLRSTRLMIVLDLRAGAQAGEGRHATLEYAVKIAVSVAQHALSRHHMVGLLGLARQPVRIPLGRGGPHYRQILEALARVRADGDTPYAEAVAEAQAELGPGGNLLLFEHGGDGAPLAGGARQPTHAIRVRFDMASFGGRLASRMQPRAGAHVVCCGDDLSRVFGR
jgi:uncharacterized protein (DUF58 family)